MNLYIGKTEINRNLRETVEKIKSRKFTILNITEVQESWEWLVMLDITNIYLHVFHITPASLKTQMIPNIALKFLDLLTCLYNNFKLDIL